MPKAKKLTAEQEAELRALWTLRQTTLRSAKTIGRLFGISGFTVLKYVKPGYRREVLFQQKCRDSGVSYEKHKVRT